MWTRFKVQYVHAPCTTLKQFKSLFFDWVASYRQSFCVDLDSLMMWLKDLMFARTNNICLKLWLLWKAYLPRYLVKVYLAKYHMWNRVCLVVRYDYNLGEGKRISCRWRQRFFWPPKNHSFSLDPSVWLIESTILGEHTWEGCQMLSKTNNNPPALRTSWNCSSVSILSGSWFPMSFEILFFLEMVEKLTVCMTSWRTSLKMSLKDDLVCFELFLLFPTPFGSSNLKRYQLVTLIHCVRKWFEFFFSLLQTPSEH